MKNIRFSLKLFFVLVACVMVACGIFAERAARQHKTVIELGQIEHEGLKLQIWYDDGPKNPSDWFAPIEKRRLSYNFLHSVHSVAIPWKVRNESDARQLWNTLSLLRRLPKLSIVYVYPGCDESVVREIKRSLSNVRIEVLVVPIVG